MTSNHFDQLDKWYEEAEKGTPRVGDLFISPYPSGVGYEVGVMDEDGLPGNMLLATRILARAPKPKPAWHGAVAVVATRNRDSGYAREVWANVGGGRWHGAHGGIVNADDLTDVTPLIEAKVTDEMAKRARAQSMKWEFGGISGNAARAILTAALGLETA